MKSENGYTVDETMRAGFEKQIPEINALGFGFEYKSIEVPEQERAFLVLKLINKADPVWNSLFYSSDGLEEYLKAIRDVCIFGKDCIVNPYEK